MTTVALAYLLGIATGCLFTVVLIFCAEMLARWRGEDW